MKNNRNGSTAISNPVRLPEFLTDALFYIAGTGLYAVSVSVFMAPNQIAPGGITGISTILHYLFGTPIGIMIFVLNIPLFYLGMRYIGGVFVIKTIVCTAMVSVLIDLTQFLPSYTGDKLLAALYGGVLSGAGLALVFLRGSTTGGTDIAIRLLRLKYPLPMGRLMLLINLLIVLAASAVFKSFDNALYAILVIFASSRVIDGILYGSDTGRMVIIISDREKEIASAISQQIHRGATLLKGTGFFTGREHNVILCAVRRGEAAKIHSIVLKADPAAFIIICNAGEVFGQGFKPMNQKD